MSGNSFGPVDTDRPSPVGHSDGNGHMHRRKDLKENIHNFENFVEKLKKFRPSLVECEEFKSNEEAMWDVFRIWYTPTSEPS